MVNGVSAAQIKPLTISICQKQWDSTDVKAAKGHVHGANCILKGKDCKNNVMTMDLRQRGSA